MPDESIRDESTELDDIIADYIVAEEAGENVSREELLKQHPKFADDLEQFFTDRDRFKRLASPLSPEASRNNDLPATVRYFGDYELLEEIAQGGMGVVYKARQTSLNRIVAVKMILAGHLASDDDVKRFTDEAETAANLRHKAIVPIHEVGQQKGQRYFSMDYIEGMNLAELIYTNPPSPDEAARIVKAIAEAVDYAHEQGTIHRDIKPSNILIDKTGQVHITDFGLAMRVEGSSELTRTGQVLGTPSYMSPEQATAKRDLIGPTTDIYSLGAILYELLTGRPPFRGETAVETIQQVVDKEPIQPKRLQTDTPRDLETICLKCLEKEPNKRYGTAALLSDDLGRYLADEPIVARPVGRVERAWRWCKRQPVVASMSAAIVALLVVGTFVSTYFALERNHQAALATKREGEAVDAKDAEVSAKESAQRSAEESRQRLSHQYVESGVSLMNQGDLAASLPWFVESLKIDDGHPTRQATHRLRFESVLRQCPQPIRMWFGNGRIVSADLSPDRTKVVWTDGSSQAHVHDIASNDSFIFKPPSDDVELATVVFSHDGDQVILADYNSRQIFLADAKTGEWKSTWEVPDQAQSPARLMTKSPVGAVAVRCDRSQNLFVFKPTSGSKNMDKFVHSDRIRHIAFSPSGKLMGVACQDGTLHLWDIEKQTRHTEPILLGEMLNHVAFSNNGKMVATCGTGGRVFVLDTDGNRKVTLNTDDIVHTVGFSKNSRFVVSSSNDGIVSVWEARSGELKFRVSHQHAVYHLDISSDDRFLLSGDIHGMVGIWNISDGSPVCSPLKHAGGITFAKSLFGGRHVLTASNDGAVRVWQLRDLTDDVRTFFRPMLLDFCVSPSGDRVAFGGYAPSVELWDIKSGKQLQTLDHDAPVDDVEFSPNGKLLATAARNWKVRLWDVESGKLLHTLTHKSFPGEFRGLDNNCASFDAQGNRILTAMGSHYFNRGEMIVWDVKTGKPLTDALPVEVNLNYARFGPDGNLLVGAYGYPWDRQGEIVLWDAVTGQRVRELEHDYCVNHFAFSKDGQTLISVGGLLDINRGGMAQVIRWKWQEGKKLETTEVHSDFVEHVEMGPSDKRFVTASYDGTARVWDVETGQPVSPALQTSGRVSCATFDAEEHYVLTASVTSARVPTGGLRFWDWRSGQPASPPLTNSHRVFQCQILKDQTAVFGNGTLVSLRSANRGVDELYSIAGLLSGARFDNSGSVVPLTSSELKSAWQRIGLKDVAISLDDLFGEDDKAQRKFVDLTENLKTQPNNRQLLQQRATLLMRLQQWDKAALDLEAMFATGDHLWGRALAVLTYLIVNKNDLYQLHCEKLFDRIEDWEPRTTTVAGIGFALHPHTMEINHSVLECVEQNIAANNSSDWWVRHPRMGLLYRSQRYEDILETLSSCKAPTRQVGRTYHAAHLLWAAMACHRLGRHSDAKSHLNSAVEIIDYELPQPGEYVGSVPLPVWIECQVIRREAEALIDGDNANRNIPFVEGEDTSKLVDSHK